MSIMLAILVTVMLPVAAFSFTHFSPIPPFSSALKLFVTTTMKRCNIRLIIHQRSENTLLVINTLNGYFEDQSQLDAAFYVQTYTNNRKRIFQKDVRGYQSDNYTKPIWKLTKHTTCYTHLYFLSSRRDLKKSVLFHFVDFDLRKDSPDYIVFWQVNGFPIDYEIFDQHEFYGTHMDYRLWVSFSYLQNEIQISLLCANCWVSDEYFYRFSSSSISLQTQIHAKWKLFHSNHHRLISFSCHNCPEELSMTKYRKQRFWEIIQTILNSTVDFSSDFEKHFGLLAFADPLEFNLPLVYGASSPSLMYSSSFIQSINFRIFTVVRKSVMSHIGWSAIIIPIPNSLWTTILVGVLTLVVILQNLQGRYFRLAGYITGILSLYSPLTDHWEHSYSSSISKRIVFFWSIFCFSLTVIYGGELASYISFLKPPIYPTTIEDLGSTQAALISITTIYIDGPVPLFTFSQAVEILSTTNLERRKMLTNIVFKVAKYFCAEEHVEYNLYNAEMPISCRDEEVNLLRFLPQITFIETARASVVFKSVFLASDRFWVSPTSYLNFKPQIFPMVVQRNYFGKLLLPLASFWIEGGLQQIQEKTITKSMIKFVKETNVPLLITGQSPASSLAVEFAPMKLSAIKSIVGVIYVFIGVAMASLLFEVIGMKLQAINTAIKSLNN